jgi:hypothetical protein
MPSIEKIQNITGYEDYLHHKWAGRLNLTDVSQATTQAEKDILACHFEMLTMISAKKLSDNEAKQIKLAELVLWECMEGHKLRKDNRPYETHCYDVASIVASWGGGAQDIALALLHDTVEDNEPNKANPITLDIIEKLFGRKMRLSVDGLTQAKSNHNTDLTIRTHHKIYELIKINPNAIAVKIADRVHFMRTRKYMKDDVRIFKADETLNHYVPLATALGLHDAAYEMASCALSDINVMQFKLHLTMPHPNLDYDQTLKTYANFISTLPADHCLQSASQLRTPTLWDCYKLNGGSLEKIPQTYTPVFVPIVIPDEIIDSSRIDRWSERVLGIGKQMVRNGLMPENSYQELIVAIDQSMSSSSVRVTFQKDGIPVRIIFLRPYEDMQWRASIFDVNNKNKDMRKAAENKIINLQMAYMKISNPTNMTQELDDANDMLLRGAITYFDKDNHEWGLSRRSTLIDALFQIPHQKFWQKVIGAELTDKSGFSYTTYDLSTEVLDGMKINFIKSDARTFHSNWLDKATTPKARRIIRSYLINLLKEEKAKGQHISETTMAYQIRKRGVEIIHRLYAQVAKEAGLPLTKLLLSITEAEDIYRQKNFKYAFDGDGRYIYYNDFMIRVGLSDKGFRPDEGRTSVVWDVVRQLVEYQKAGKTIVIKIPAIIGAEAKLAEKLARIGINIEGSMLDHNDNEPGTGLNYITVSRNSWEKINNSGIEWFMDYLTGEILEDFSV